MKEWKDYSEEEINRMKLKICKGCRFLEKMSGTASKNISNYYCNYIGIMGHSRGCRPDECDKKEKGRKRKRTVNELFQYERR